VFNNNTTTITKGINAMNGTLELHTQHETSPVDQPGPVDTYSPDSVEVGTQTITAIIQHNDGTPPTEVLRTAQIAKPTTGVDDIVHRVRRVRTRTSNRGRHADGALALLAPAALIALMMALGLQFALAVCVMIAAVFLITTSEDAMWIWRRHTDR
jgi:hypothetical protein